MKTARLFLLFSLAILFAAWPWSTPKKSAPPSKAEYGESRVSENQAADTQKEMPKAEPIKAEPLKQESLIVPVEETKQPVTAAPKSIGVGKPAIQIAKPLPGGSRAALPSPVQLQNEFKRIVNYQEERQKSLERQMRAIRETVERAKIYNKILANMQSVKIPGVNPVTSQAINQEKIRILHLEARKLAAPTMIAAPQISKVSKPAARLPVPAKAVSTKILSEKPITEPQIKTTEPAKETA